MFPEMNSQCLSLLVVFYCDLKKRKKNVYSLDVVLTVYLLGIVTHQNLIESI